MSSPEQTRVVVLSIDGVPYSLAQRLAGNGDMPNLATLIRQGDFRQMRSAYPTVSCVAWSSYMTGKNPGKHGIYGFLERRENNYDIQFPNAATMTAENIWEIIGRTGKRVFGMNVPVTYPPRPVNGILIGGFLTPSLEKVAWPAGVADYLKSIDYRIDSNAALGRSDKHALLDDLNVTLKKRAQAMFHFLEQEPWDFFHTHIMGSDRICHFLYGKMQEQDPEFSEAFRAYFRHVDGIIGELMEKIGPDTPLLIFSDHGFCTIKKEVQLSRFLVEKGWTVPADTIKHPLSIDPAHSKAYTLIPGRIFINLKGREPGGIVPVEEYQNTREAIKKDLLDLRDPETSEPVIRTVLTREQIYWPSGQAGPRPESSPPTESTYRKAADLIAIPYNGYDLKLGLAGTKFFTNTELEGMHSYDDAFICSRHIDLPNNIEIMMLARHILAKLNIEIPPDLDGIEPGLTPEL